MSMTQSAYVRVFRVLGSARRPDKPAAAVRRAGLAAAIGLGACLSLVSADAAEAAPPAPADAISPHAPGAPVSLADVTSVVDTGKTNLPDAASLLRKDLEAEIAAFDWTKAKAARPYRVSVEIVQLESNSNGKLLQAWCAVSVAIREAKRGALLTTLVSRVKAEDLPNGAKRAERAALAAAAQKAVVGVAAAISRAP